MIRYILRKGGIMVLSLLGLSGWLVAEDSLPLGSEAPRLVVTVDSGDSLKLEDLYEKGQLVVFFYPKAMTGGCTAQACSLRDAFAELAEQGIQVIGVSRDRVALQKKFREIYQLPYPLISDTSGEVMRAFHVREIAPGINGREAFIISEGKIVWHDSRASTRTQADDVKAALEALKDKGSV